jgi:peroxiredoxin
MIMAPAVQAADDAAEKEEALKVGDVAPDFDFTKNGEDKGGKLSDYKGKKNVVIAFYPKAFTSGCTKQLCGYRDDFSKFKDADTEVIAISIDKQDDSDRFKKEYELPFNVVGDAESEIVKKYKVPVMGSNYATRSVYVVGKDGVLGYIDPAYSVSEGQEPLLDALKKLNETEAAPEAAE